MKKVWTSLVCLMICLVMLMPAGAATGTEAADQIMQSLTAENFTVLHTGDINGKETGDDAAIGYAKLAGLAAACAEKKPTILLDSGNALAGDGGKTISLMENVQYTAACIGTRDAALGIERLQELAARANFPLLCANWLQADGDLFWDPYTIVQVGNQLVGVIGLISPDIAEMYPEITANCNVYDPIGIANIYYEEMAAQGCSYYIALTSLGYDGEYTPRTLGQACPWLNLILDSNTTEETALDHGELVSANSGVIIFNLKPDFAQVGEIDVTTGTADGMNTTYPAVYTAQDLKDVKENKQIEELVKQEYVEPGTEDIAAEGNGTTVTVSGGSMTMVVYLVCFAGIIAVTAVIIFLVMKKSAGGKKKVKQ